MTQGRTSALRFDDRSIGAFVVNEIHTLAALRERIPYGRRHHVLFHPCAQHREKPEFWEPGWAPGIGNSRDVSTHLVGSTPSVAAK
jgi:hypothetical protein